MSKHISLFLVVISMLTLYNFGQIEGSNKLKKIVKSFEGDDKIENWTSDKVGRYEGSESQKKLKSFNKFERIVEGSKNGKSFKVSKGIGIDKGSSSNNDGSSIINNGKVGKVQDIVTEYKHDVVPSEEGIAKSKSDIIIREVQVHRRPATADNNAWLSILWWVIVMVVFLNVVWLGLYLLVAFCKHFCCGGDKHQCQKQVKGHVWSGKSSPAPAVKGDGERSVQAKV